MCRNFVEISNNIICIDLNPCPFIRCQKKLIFGLEMRIGRNKESDSNWSIFFSIFFSFIPFNKYCFNSKIHSFPFTRLETTFQICNYMMVSKWSHIIDYDFNQCVGAMGPIFDIQAIARMLSLQFFFCIAHNSKRMTMGIFHYIGQAPTQLIWKK